MPVNTISFETAHPDVQRMYTDTLSRLGLEQTVVTTPPIVHGRYNDMNGMQPLQGAPNHATAPVYGSAPVRYGNEHQETKIIEQPVRGVVHTRPRDLAEASVDYTDPATRWRNIYHPPSSLRHPDDGRRKLTMYAESTDPELKDMERVWGLIEDDTSTKRIARDPNKWHTEADTPSVHSNAATERIFTNAHDIQRHRRKRGNILRLIRRIPAFIGYTALTATDAALAVNQYAPHIWHA